MTPLLYSNPTQSLVRWWDYDEVSPLFSTFVTLFQSLVRRKGVQGTILVRTASVLLSTVNTHDSSWCRPKAWNSKTVRVLFAVWSRVEAVEGTLWYRVVSVNLRRKRDLCGRVLSEGAYHQVLSTLTDNHTNQNSLMLFRMLGGETDR